MIKQISFHNWKSYQDADLFIDPLTVLIGANASGKSNAIDALALLNRIASGVSFTSAIAGDANLPAIRGGLEWAALKPHSSEFTLEAIISGSAERTDFMYSTTVSVGNGQCLLTAESLKRLKYRSTKRKQQAGKPYEVFLYRTDSCDNGSPSITARLYNEKMGSPWPASRTHAILTQLAGQKLRKEIAEGISEVTESLRNIFILDPIPAHMRNYTPFSDRMETDAANIAGVIAALPENHKTEMEGTLTDYVRHLPEKDIQKVWAEPVGRFKSDAMLYCQESWKNGDESTLVDARGMSDGTLRFLAILTALQTRPNGSLLVVEEIDTGLHPSRAQLIVRMLREIGQSRGVDVLATTHNPALLDALGTEIVPFVTISHRDRTSGFSNLTLLEDLKQLPKLLAHGPVGRMVSQGLIENALKAEPDHA